MAKINLILTILKLNILEVWGEGFLEAVGFVHDYFLFSFTSELSSRQSITGVLPVLTQILAAGSGPGFLEWLE